MLIDPQRLSNGLDIFVTNGVGTKVNVCDASVDLQRFSNGLGSLITNAAGAYIKMRDVIVNLQRLSNGLDDTIDTHIVKAQIDMHDCCAVFQSAMVSAPSTPMRLQPRLERSHALVNLQCLSDGGST